MESAWLQSLGCKATFRTKVDDVLYTGDIQNIDIENQTITFFKVTVVETGKIFNSLQNFHCHEIYDLEIDEDVVNVGLKTACLKKETNQNEGKQRAGKREIKKHSVQRMKDEPKHLRKFHVFDPTDLQMKQIVEKEIERTSDENGAYESDLPDKCTLLDDCQSQLFKDAIAHLKACHTLGVAFEGIRLGRDGKLCWIVVSTEDHTMFFDMVKMGKTAFEAGLKDLLQAKSIMKVIHDCRLPSDLLFHQYDVKLVNIFDSQVAAAYLEKLQHNNGFQRFVSSLSDCLYFFLGIDRSSLCFPLVRAHCPEEDESVYAMRPPPSLVYQWMHKHCFYLVSLHDRQMEDMLLEFTVGVDIYLSNLRDLNTSEAKMRQERQHVLPLEFMGLPAEVVALRAERQGCRRKRISQRFQASKDSRGMQENCTGISHPQVIASHDTIWHSAVYSKCSGKKINPEEHSSQKQKDKRSSEPKTRDTSEYHGMKSPLGNVSRGHSKRHHSSSHTPNGKTQGEKASLSSSSDAEQPSKLHNLKQSLLGRGQGRVDVSGAEAVFPPISPAGVSSAAEKLDAECLEKSKTLTVLQQSTREQLEREKNEKLNSQNMDVVFRAARETSYPKTRRKKEKELLAHHQSDSDGDLAGRVMNHKPDKLTGNEFDAIPYQKALADNYRSSHANDCSSSGTSGSVPAAPLSVGLSHGGFKIDSFAETVPPAPFTGGSSPQTDRASARRKALEAILPQVDDKTMLLEGSRSDASRKNTGFDTEGCRTTYSLVELLEETDETVTSPSAAAVSNGQSEGFKPTQLNGVNGENVGSHLGYLKSILQQAGISTASDIPPMLQDSTNMSAAEKMVHGCQADSSTTLRQYTTHSTQGQISNGASMNKALTSSSSDTSSSSVCQNNGNNCIVKSALKVDDGAAGTDSPTPAASASPQSTSSGIAPRMPSTGGKSVMALLGFTLSPQERMMRHCPPAKSDAVS